MHTSRSISSAGGHAHSLYMKTVNGNLKENNVTEEQKNAFLKRKTHKCKHQNARVSMDTCKINIERAIRIKQSGDPLYSDDKFLKCLDCKYAKKIGASVEPKVKKRKPCKTYEEFGDLCPNSSNGGWCIETTIVHGSYARGHFNNKIYCCSACATRYNNLKDRGTVVVGGVMYRWNDRIVK